MQPDLATSHHDTLMEWADLWQRDGASGTEEIAFLLRRAAGLIIQEADAEPLPPYAASEDALREG